MGYHQRGGFGNYGFAGNKRKTWDDEDFGENAEEYKEEEEEEPQEHRNANRQPIAKRAKTEEGAENAGGNGNEFRGSRGTSAIRQRFEKAAMKQWRLIIRNMPFKTKKEDLQNICSNFGRFVEIVLPPSKKNPKSIAGFGFIQFVKKEDAEKAREWFNANKILGRSVAADWALDKDTFETNAHEEKANLKKKVKVEKMEEEKKEEENDEEEEDSENESESESENEEEEDEETPKKSSKKSTKKEIKTDQNVIDGKVVFLRSLAFDTKIETIKEELARFGIIDLAIICKYKDSGHPKGTAFVHFSTPLEASNCIDGIEEGLIIDNRLIKANLAIPRKEAVDMEKDKLTKVPKDKRNLRLVRFGLIRAGTEVAKGMSKEDAAKRERLAEAMRKKLENTNMFVSPVRLCVHNLPQRINDEKLREIAQKASISGATITECRVWMDKNRLTADKKPKSAGFGFVAFKEHDQALACLKGLNNNPDIFGKESRPIVEFSIENLMALQARARRSVKVSEEKMSERVMNEKIRQQVKQSIGEVHTAGMKFLPKFTGVKIRHRNLTGKAKKKVEAKNRSKQSKAGAPPPAPSKSLKKKSMKNVTKYLSLSA
ncbi:unnamed protein product [Caenorhabditis angaria]|uniref:RRM domain-containing protein n=1 Tax=Caenorhabditis angaria TaxID=860376 RepID=A0A9P1MUR3_9PELO|nr:unnamed protein product [Caenorhabditis angaria]